MKNLLSAAAVSVVVLGMSAGVDAASITGVTIEDFSSQLTTGEFRRFAEHTVDNAGWPGNGTHSINPEGTMWLTRHDVGHAISDAFIVFNLGGFCDLTSMDVWNYNEVNLTSRGVNATDVSVSTDNVSYTSLGNYNFAVAPGDDTTVFTETHALVANGIRYVKFDIQTSHGDATFVGLSEVKFTGTVLNLAPDVDAGPHQEITLPVNSVQLDGTVTDDGVPDPPGAVTTQWEVVRGTGAVEFADAGAVDTTATFSAAGPYTLKLTADDGEFQGVDTVRVMVLPTEDVDYLPNVTIESFSSQLASGAFRRFADHTVDNAGWSAEGWHAIDPEDTMWLTGTDGSPAISDAFIVFNLGGLYDLTWMAVWNYNENLSVNLTNRGVQDAEVLVSADNVDWTSLGDYRLAEAPGDPTTGFTDPHALVAGGVRYVKFDIRTSHGDSTYVGLSEVKFTGTVLNLAPDVDAGPDQEITVPANTVLLDGTVTDDGVPDPPGAVTTLWEVVRGTGTVNFADAGAVDTTATFSTAGPYTLKLTADDGGLQSTDTLRVMVLPAGGVQYLADVTIAGFSSELAVSFNRPAAFVVDASGWPGDGTHAIDPDGSMWLTDFDAGQTTAEAWITFDLGDLFDLAWMDVWNYNENLTVDLTHRGVKDTDVLVSPDNAAWTSLGDYRFAEAPGADNVPFADSHPLVAQDVRYVKFDIHTNHGAEGWAAGLSEVRFVGRSAPLSDPFADADMDDDVDQTDYAHLQRCLTDDDLTPPTVGCSVWDRDLDGAIDAMDVEKFMACVSGPAIPADKTCDD